MNKFSDLTVNYNCNALEAIKAINKSKAYIALVVDERNKLIGTITDGDIRRGLLNGEKLDSNVQNFMHKNFLSINESEISKINIEKIIEDNIMPVPLLIQREGLRNFYKKMS